MRKLRVPQPLAAGDLDYVDRYGWTDAKTVRCPAGVLVQIRNPGHWERFYADRRRWADAEDDAKVDMLALARRTRGDFERRGGLDDSQIDNYTVLASQYKVE